MSAEKPRLARLSAILTHLQSGRIITATDLADRYEISIRTVYRDIRTLEQSGVPIVTIEGKGYSLVEGYKIPPVMFTEEETLALTTAEQLISKNKDASLAQHFTSALTKIRAVLKIRQQSKTEILSDRLQVRNNRDNEKTSKYLIQLQSTIANFQVVEIEYLSLRDYRTQRKVEPFALYTTNDNWILIGYCCKARDFRAFRLDRIQRLVVTNEVFEPHDLTLEQYLETCRKKWTDTPDIPLSQTPSTFAVQQKNNVMQKVEIKPFHLIGIAIRTSNANGKAAQEIAELWGRFLSEKILEQIPNKVDDTIYSMYTDYEGDHNQPYTAILGCKVRSVEQVPDGFISKSVSGGEYVKLTAKGDLTKGLVVNQWSKIWEMDLPRKYSADFELFGDKAQNPLNAEVEFYIAVKE